MLGDVFVGSAVILVCHSVIKMSEIQIMLLNRTSVSLLLCVGLFLASRGSGPEHSLSSGGHVRALANRAHGPVLYFIISIQNRGLPFASAFGVPPVLLIWCAFNL